MFVVLGLDKMHEKRLHDMKNIGLEEEFQEMAVDLGRGIQGQLHRLSMRWGYGEYGDEMVAEESWRNG